MSRTLSRHKRLLLAPLTSLTVALGLAVLPAASAQAAPADTSVSIQLRRTATAAQAPGNQLFGVFFDTIGPAIPEDTFAITGRLTEDIGQTGLAGRRVHLFRQKYTQSGVTEIPTDANPVLTDANGNFRFTAQKVVGTAAYWVTYEPEADDIGAYNPSSSTDNSVDPAVISAWRDFNASKRKANGKLYFRGDINPGWGGHAVKLQRKTCSACGFKTIATKAASRTGGWQFPVAYPGKVGPVWTYRAVIGGSGDFPGLNSSVWLTTRRVYARGGAGTVAHLG